MASKKWDDLSSSDEENNEHHKEFRHKTKPGNSQPKETKPEKQETSKPQEQQQEESKEQTQEKPHFNNRKKPLQGKGDMIDEVKKLEELNIGVNIFNCQENVVAADIYNNFKDITFDKIIKDRQRSGQFTCYFQTKDHCIHFIKVAPRVINGQRFLMRLTKPSKKIQNDEWNEVGAGGRTLQKENKFQRGGFQPSYKQQDRQGKPKPQYNRKEHHNDGYVQPEQKPVKEQQQQDDDEQKVKNEESHHKVFKKDTREKGKQDYHHHYGKYSKYDNQQKDSEQIRQEGAYKHKIHNSKHERGEKVPQKKSSDDVSRNPKIFGKAVERDEQQAQHEYNKRHGIKDGIDEKEQKQEEEEWHESGHGQKPPKNNTIPKKKGGLQFSEW